MSCVLTSKRAALDVITMQRRPSCYRHHKKMLLKIVRRSIQQGPGVSVGAINQLQQQNLKELQSSPCFALHCRQCVSLITSRIEGTLFIGPASTRTIHTATSPSGTDSHVLLSSRWGKFTSQDDARRQVARLSAEERGHLEKAIQDLKERNEEAQSEPPTWNQLKLCKAVLHFLIWWCYLLWSFSSC